MSGVIRTFDAAGKDSIVACVLALQTQAITDNPGKGVKPIDDAQRLRDHLENPVTAPDMGQFVSEHNPGPLFPPFDCARRQNDLGPQHTPGHQYRRILALQQTDGPLQSIFGGDLGGQTRPMAVWHRLRSARNPNEPR